MENVSYFNWSKNYDEKYVKNVELLFQQAQSVYLNYDKLPLKTILRTFKLYRKCYLDTIEICKSFLSHNAILHRNELQTVQYFMYMNVSGIKFYHLYRGFKLHGKKGILPKKYFGPTYIAVLKTLNAFFDNQIKKEASYVLER